MGGGFWSASLGGAAPKLGPAASLPWAFPCVKRRPLFTQDLFREKNFMHGSTDTAVFGGRRSPVVAEKCAVKLFRRFYNFEKVR